MAVPKKKHSKARTRKRRAHHALAPKNLARCQRCHATVRPHTICGNCGHYLGEQIVDMEAIAS
ncbi:MAG: 50S ribosomal protein L32 [Planctomycetota bacterium]|nr:MAG: 50S ribosomal protein L32 [Planctomycetota bacterium]